VYEPAVGAMLLVKYMVCRPTSAPSTPLIMKLPYLIRFTWMPASRAPSRFPPAAIVCRPQRVRVSTIWNTMVSATAQTMSAHE
jgi:hypothetical protein